MAARAMWKGVIRFGEARVPVKLYSAVEDRTVHFRLLHETDHAPVRQAMINPRSGEEVPYGETRRGYVTDDGHIVMFEQDELAAVEPEPSRDIEVVRFLPEREIDHRWYRRPYYLGPDGNRDAYFALVDALEGAQREGLARWVMRNKEYVGALRLHGDHPMLIALRHAEQVIPLDALDAPKGAALDDKELTMAQQLMDMLEAPFRPDDYRDAYRERVLELVEAKSRGETVEPPPAPKRPRPRGLRGALEASLEQARHG